MTETEERPVAAIDLDTQANGEDEQSVRVFICYRREDASVTASWLHQLLHQIRYRHANTDYRTSVYYDEAAPGVADWQSYHLPSLKRAHAFVIIASPGIATNFSTSDGKDFVYAELNWWLENRNTVPIVIDPTKDGHLWLPRSIKTKWPKLNRILVSQQLIAERDFASDHANRIRNRIVDTIVEAENSTVHEDLVRLTRLTRRMRVGFALTAILSIATGVFAWRVIESRGQAEEARLQAERQLDVAERTNRLMTSLFEAADPDKNFGVNLPASELLVTGLRTVDNTDVPVQVRAQLLRSIASAYIGLGDSDRAVDILVKAKGLTENYVPTQRERFALELALGEAYSSYEDARFELSKAHLEKALTLAREVHGGEPHEDVSWALGALANFTTWTDESNLNVAESLYQEALEIDRKLGLSRSVSRDLTRLAAIAFYKDNLQESDRLYEEALAAIENEDAPLLLAQILHDRAANRYERGRLAQALKDYQQAHQLMTRVYGEQHSEVAEAGNSLGRVLIETGKFKEATEILEKVVSIQQEEFGENFAGLVYSRNNLGLSMLLDDRHIAAREQFNAVASICTDSQICQEGEQRLFAQSIIHLAETYLLERDLDQTERLLDEAKKKFTELDLIADWRYSIWQGAMAELRILQCRLTDARAELGPARESVITRWAPENPFRKSYEERIAMLELAEARQNGCKGKSG